MLNPNRSQSFALLKRQAAACAVFGLLLTCIVAALYVQHRQREWVLRTQQAQHRLDVVFDRISREVNRVRADAMYLANCNSVKEFVAAGNSGQDHPSVSSPKLATDFVQFVQQKQLYDQIRLLDLSGRETVRVNFSGESTRTVEQHALQDKSDRYYFQEALYLQRGELFVSEFDLNLEHGSIEQPLKPVIRFVTPVYDQNESVAAYVVLNYLGGELLSKLDDAAIPGKTLLLRRDGHYIAGPTQEDEWGWLLGHNHSFATQFPDEWLSIGRLQICQLMDDGAFAAKTIPLGQMEVRNADSTQSSLSKTSTAKDSQIQSRDSITLVSYLPRELVFASSNELLQRLLLLAGGAFALAIFFTRAWAAAILSRQLQAARIADSEERLRELSSRLLRIQEEERRAISREIHDELGQQATAIGLDLKLAERNLDVEKAKPHLQRAIHENETLLRTLHEFARRVRPAVLDDLGLIEAIESHSLEFAKRTGVHVETELELASVLLPDEIADHSFRLVQESLNNVAKHAGASNVEVDMSVGHDERELLICIRDDGCGHTDSETSGGLGLIGMRERVDLLGGIFDIESSKNGGTRVTMRLPLNSPQPGAAACQ